MKRIKENLLENGFAVNIRSQEESDIFLEWLEENTDKLWSSGNKPTNPFQYNFKEYGEQTVIHVGNDLTYDYIGYNDENMFAYAEIWEYTGGYIDSEYFITCSRHNGKSLLTIENLQEMYGGIVIPSKSSIGVDKEVYMESLKTKIYFHRAKDENFELEEEVNEHFGDKLERELHDIVYTGYEIEMDIEVTKEGKVKVLKLEGEDISNKNIEIL